MGSRKVLIAVTFYAAGGKTTQFNNFLPTHYRLQMLATCTFLAGERGGLLAYLHHLIFIGQLL